jgi:hypothetical protein
MPDPRKFKNEKEWMSACMPHLLTIEKKKRDQAIAQCLNMWRQWKKKTSAHENKLIAKRVIIAFLKKKSESRGQTLQKDISLEKWRRNLDKKVTPLGSPMTPYKEGEEIEVLINNKFVKVPFREELKEEKFFYLEPKTKELKVNEPVHG